MSGLSQAASRPMNYFLAKLTRPRVLIPGKETSPSPILIRLSAAAPTALRRIKSAYHLIRIFYLFACLAYGISFRTSCSVENHRFRHRYRVTPFQVVGFWLEYEHETARHATKL